MQECRTNGSLSTCSPPRNLALIWYVASVTPSLPVSYSFSLSVSLKISIPILKLNRDTWGNEAVAQTIKTYFIFWQVRVIVFKESI